jgi:hypothetical protein
MWDTLAPHARLVAIDLPGFGQSEGREDLRSPRAMGRFLSSSSPRPTSAWLSGSSAGEQAERRLELTEDRRLARGEPHVTGQHEFAAGTAYSSLYLRNGDQAAGAQVMEQECD